MFQDLQSALRRAGQNPTESEVQDMMNKIDDGTASLAFADFCLLIGEKAKELDAETHFKDTFRVFSKDEEGTLHSEFLNVNILSSYWQQDFWIIFCVEKWVTKNELNSPTKGVFTFI